jgi:hypothetical protein
MMDHRAASASAAATCAIIVTTHIGKNGLAEESLWMWMWIRIRMSTLRQRLDELKRDRSLRLIHYHSNINIYYTNQQYD